MFANPDPRTVRRLRSVAVMLALVAASVLVILLIRSFLADAGKPRKASIQQIAILRPPPPPPPKPEQKPPEPEMKKQEVKLPDPPKEPEAKPADAPPAGDKLGLDADGTGGSDGFGLAARKGGRNLLTIGQGGGTGGRSEYAWFGGRLQRHVQEELSKLRELQGSDYRVVVRIWLAGDGRIHRAELVGTTGNPDTDRAIQTSLMRAPALAEPPPESMPQPVRLRIGSRAAG